MAIRELVRGSVDWSRLEAVAREVARRHDRDQVRVEFVEADNWLSVPMVVDEDLFVKVISRQHVLVHALFTAGRNLGAVSAGRQGFFQRAGDPLAMAEHELAATRKMRAAGVAAPAPVEAFEVDGLGVLVLEYLPDFRPLDAVDDDRLEEVAPALFANLSRMHEAGLVHGDLRAENVLLSGGDLYFVDATVVEEDAADDDGCGDAEAYDLACALATLAPRLGARRAVEAALGEYDADALVRAADFLDFVNLRPDHRFDAARIRGEVEDVAA